VPTEQLDNISFIITKCKISAPAPSLSGKSVGLDRAGMWLTLQEYLG
jgi:hypothetical protein